jgi:toxin-antitoxin system PIN domain toxin
MIIVDANILLYAYDATSSRHDSARAWLEEVLNGSERVGMPLTVLLAFLRLSTDRAVFQDPLTTPEAIEIVTSWLARPNVAVTMPSDRHWRVLDETAAAGQARGPRLMDAHLAALAIEHGAAFASVDRGFARFPTLRWRDPLSRSGQAS